MQSFNEKQHQDFINYFNIKKYPSQIEMDFLEKTKKYIRFIKYLPWLRMVWIWNSISMNCADRNSDIDLYIVTTSNSMWFNRILITLIFQLLWVRKTRQKHAWRFCLSFFSTLGWMNFNSWKIKNDIYLYFWILYFKPILDIDNTYSLFIDKNSSWADFSRYNSLVKSNKDNIIYKNETKNKSNNFLITYLDRIIKKVFIKKTLKSYGQIWKPYWIIINKDLLKFHNNDIRKKISDDLL